MRNISINLSQGEYNSRLHKQSPPARTAISHRQGWIKSDIYV
ncbi:hypothetical protein [Anabaena azotica]|nr:hypothetical protein [Anabaena azotica]